MKKISKVLLTLFMSVFLLSSFTAKAPVKKDPTVAPYVSALAMYQAGRNPDWYIDIWVRWAQGTTLSRDYYADVSVTYTDNCRVNPPWTVVKRCIVKAGQWMSFTDFNACGGGQITIVTYSLVAWGPL